MNDEIVNVLKELDKKQDTHPYLTALWKEKMLQNLNFSNSISIEQDILHCNQALQYMNSIPDITPEQVTLLRWLWDSTIKKDYLS